ncbi:MAG: ABC transporter ATP-binding protein [Gallionella sp.]
MLLLPPLRDILSLFSHSDRKQALVLLFVIFLTSIIEVMGVVSIMPFMAIVAKPEIIQTNQYIHSMYTYMGFSSINRFLFLAGLIFFFIMMAGNAISALSAWMLYRFAFAFEQKLAERLLTSYLAQPFPFFLRTNSAILSKNILTETETVVTGAIIPVMQLITKAMVVLLMLIMLMFIDPLLAITVALIIGTAYSVTYILIRRKLLDNGQLSSEANTQNYKFTNEALGGAKEIKLLGKEQAFVERFSISSKLQAGYKVIGYTLSLLPKYAIESMAFGGMLLILVYLLGLRKDISIAFPLIALYAFAGYRMLPAIQQIFQSLSNIRYTFPALQNLKRDLSSLPVTFSTYVCPQEAMPYSRDIKLDSVFFTYPECDSPVINNLSLCIKNNTSIGLVGTTGSGKSTLIDIILGLLEPQAGEMRVDGKRITPSNVKSWQKNVGYVPQQIYLVDDTIASNIALGCPANSIDMVRVEEVARIANLHDFVTLELPNNYQTIVGERGVRLSGGQRQRIGIARALYHNPKVLVLDEATSALDGITERIIIDTIQALSHKITIVMIAHRLTTVKDCDVIYLLDHGKIVQHGTFQELVGSNETFKQMLNA